MEALIRKVMKERGLPFKQALNLAVRQGLSGMKSTDEFRTPTFRMGFYPEVPPETSLRLATGLEDEALIRRLAGGGDPAGAGETRP